MTRPTGLLGGSFDPVHKAHIQIACHCCRELDLHQVRFIPVGQPVHRSALLAGAEHRLAMLHLATAEHPELTVDEIELQRPGGSYTIDTLKALKQTARILCLVMGEDVFHTLPAWKDWQHLFSYAHVVVLNRQQGKFTAFSPAMRQVLEQRLTTDKKTLHEQKAGAIYRLGQPVMDISATAIRQQPEAMATRSLLPGGVFDYIQKNRLYRSS